MTRLVGRAQHPSASASLPPSPFPPPRRPRSVSNKRECPQIVISSLLTWSNQPTGHSSLTRNHTIMSDLRLKGYHCIFVYIITFIYSKHLHTIFTIEHMNICLIFRVFCLVCSLCYCLLCYQHFFLVGLGLERILVLQDTHQFNSYHLPQPSLI